MEEKLYFKPADYGKVIEKKDKPEKPDGSNKNDNHHIRNLILFLALIAIIVLIILWLLHGKTTIRGQYPENIKNESLSCISTTAIYEKADERIADKRELKINAVFYGENNLSAIGLRYAQDFENNGDA